MWYSRHWNVGAVYRNGLVVRCWYAIATGNRDSIRLPVHHRDRPQRFPYMFRRGAFAKRLLINRDTILPTVYKFHISQWGLSFSGKHYLYMFRRGNFSKRLLINPDRISLAIWQSNILRWGSNFSKKLLINRDRLQLIIILIEIV